MSIPDLIALLMKKTMEEVTETFDLVFDFTGYSPAVDLPKFWIQRIAQLCPPRLLQMVNVCFLSVLLELTLMDRSSLCIMSTPTLRNASGALLGYCYLSVRPFL